MTGPLDENSEQRLREILRSEVENVRPSPDALEKIRARTGTGRFAWLQAAWLRPVGAVAAAALIAGSLMLSATPFRDQISTIGEDSPDHPVESVAPAPTAEDEDDLEAVEPSPAPGSPETGPSPTRPSPGASPSEEAESAEGSTSSLECVPPPSGTASPPSRSGEASEASDDECDPSAPPDPPAESGPEEDEDEDDEGEDEDEDDGEQEEPGPSPTGGAE